MEVALFHSVIVCLYDDTGWIDSDSQRFCWQMKNYRTYSFIIEKWTGGTIRELWEFENIRRNTDKGRKWKKLSKKNKNSAAVNVCLVMCLSCKNGMGLKLYFHLIKKKWLSLLLLQTSLRILKSLKKILRFSFTCATLMGAPTQKPIAINSVSHTQTFFFTSIDGIGSAKAQHLI